MPRSLSSRFPKVMAMLLGSSAAASDDDEQKKDGEGAGDEELEQDEQQQDGEGDGDGDGEGAGDDGDGEGGEEGAGDGEGEGTGSAAAPRRTNNAALLRAFEQDANALVSAEQQRCIAIFTSDAGRANPDGAASVIRSTDMDAKAGIEFLGTVGGGSSKSAARARLRNAEETRPKTGASTERTNESGPVADAKKTRAERNKAAKARGGKKVGAVSGGDDD